MNHSTILPFKRAAAATVAGLLALCAIALGGTARASIAYGSINNFDTVNDTGKECHGFEIELEDCHSTDITYTYNYNHYGAPKITQDDSVAGHPKCIIRWESKKNADGTWAAYTAIPAGPISPTNGHMFTNPGVNFGGEHFGVGYRVAVGAVRYQWLIDNGAGVLTHGGAVQVSTPSFNYYPPVAGNPAPAQVQAVIAPPPPPAPEPKEFGKAVWVKEIRTTTHNNREVKLRDLVSDDPDKLNDKNWKNGEPDEVEVEWQILQKDYHKADGGANNAVPAGAEDLPGGDEVVTRRYEFYKYVGPLDNESGEAMCQNVGADGIHGDGVKIINGVSVDLSTVEVVGGFTGAQMAAVDVDAQVGLIDHVGEGTVDVEFAARTVVIEGVHPFTATMEGALPAGMTFDQVTGVLSGTPTESGAFQFKIAASDGVNPDVSKNYTLMIAAAGAEPPPASLLDTTVSPAGSGTTTGDGSYDIGVNATVTAAPVPGHAFLNWTDNGTVVSTNSTYTLAMDVNHSLVANFVPAVTVDIVTSAVPAAGGTTSGGGICNSGSNVTVTATANAGYAFVDWTENGVSVSASASYAFVADTNKTLVANFTPVYALNITAAGGTVTANPDQATYAKGTVVTLTATPTSPHLFGGWTGDATGMQNPLQVTMDGDKNITANFPLATFTVTPGSGAGGSVSPAVAQTIASGGSVTFTATPALNGYGVDQWLVNNVSVQAGGNSFTLANVTADTNVQVTFKRSVPVLHPFAPGPWTATSQVNELITADNNPTRFSVTGLPAGVVLNASTGQLSGRPTAAITARRIYHLVVTATNITGTSAPVKVDVTVEPVPAAMVGTFNGLVDRDGALSGGFGGTLNLVSTATGAFSGRLTLGAASYGITAGRLDAALGTDATSTIVIKRTLPLHDLTMAITINRDSGRLTGTITDGTIPVPVNLQAWKKTAPAAVLATTYTAVLELEADLAGTTITPANVAYPQGNGFGTLVITSAGAARWTGRMADGTPMTCSTTVGEGGEVPLHAMLYAKSGSAHGWIAASGAVEPLLDGGMDWSKNPQSAASTTRSYKDGFPVHNLTVTGGKYVRPAAPAIVLGLIDNGSGTTNARLTFTEGGLEGPVPIVPSVMAAAPNIAVRITAAGTAVVPTVAANPAAVTLVLDAATGVISGTFVLKDNDPTDHAAPFAVLRRTVTYRGLLVPRTGVNKGAGYFLLPKLPEDGPPKTTPGTSEILSGQVVLEASP